MDAEEAGRLNVGLPLNVELPFSSLLLFFAFFISLTATYYLPADGAEPAGLALLYSFMKSSVISVAGADQSMTPA
jgi:hypothetical protein